MILTVLLMLSSTFQDFKFFPLLGIVYDMHPFYLLAIYVSWNFARMTHNVGHFYEQSGGMKVKLFLKGFSEIDNILMQSYARCQEVLSN